VLQNHLRSRISKGAPTSPFEASLGEREAALVNKTRSRYIFENRILNASGFQRRDSRRKHPGRREKGPRLKTGTSKPHIKQGLVVKGPTWTCALGNQAEGEIRNFGTTSLNR